MSHAIPLSTAENPDGRPAWQYWMVWGHGPSVEEALADMARKAQAAGAHAVRAVHLCAAPDVATTYWREEIRTHTQYTASGTAVTFRDGGQRTQPLGDDGRPLPLSPARPRKEL
ncbi:hypothetical protein [Streptomyces sp. RFCAC02]|uniref:hypothetical protein n=1 Tax=Streptomyces sp. RFCAC02 TaxID=2499143 RepID=UPI00102034D6|nr:hypothetical protein [Streptomyces sp. RFCAC02]